jgi:hypothetical protein
MTIRKRDTGGPQTPKAASGAGRVRRPTPEAAGPNRSSTAASRRMDPFTTSGGAGDAKVSDAVAHVVKVGYDVIAENIRQGREAAERFSKGKYRLGEAPGDLEVAGQRLLHLARELSTTTFDVCERLLKEVAAQRPPADRAGDVPPFKAPVPPKPARPAPTDTGMMKVTVQFHGAPKAIAHTTGLERPRRPAAAADVMTQPLAPTAGDAKPIPAATFTTDVSIGGIVAVVSVPEGQPPGVYSGLALVKGDPIPLGVFTVEIPK